MITLKIKVTAVVLERTAVRQKSVHFRPRANSTGVPSNIPRNLRLNFQHGE